MTKVCILTAGRGTRMGPYADVINKALLPVEGRAVISHIIEQFPELEFVIALGHLGDQVREYLSVGTSDVKFTFVEVEKAEGPGSGPARSLWECREHLKEPFWFFTSDTLVDMSPYYNMGIDPATFEVRHAIDYCEDFIGIARIDDGEKSSYLNLVNSTSGSGPEVMIRAAHPDGAWSFAGYGFITNSEPLWRSIEENLDQEQVEFVHAFEDYFEAYGQSRRYNLCGFPGKSESWRDTGTYERYQRVIGAQPGFDFSKPNEFFYRVGNRVIKFFADHSIVRNRLEKHSLNPGVFPKIVGRAEQFYAYEYVDGQTLYEKLTPKLFGEFLEWLRANLWTERRDDIKHLALPFYWDKTNERLAEFYKRNPDFVEPIRVNGKEVYDISMLDDLFSHGYFFRGHPSFIHGDLQFDNVVATPDGFTLLDWRQDFSGRTDVGDLVYDFAKLLGGIRTNYDLIKRGEFSYSEDDEDYNYSVTRRSIMSRYEDMLRDFAENEYNIPWNNIEVITGLIYLNMAGLHKEPFDRILYCMGMETLTRVMKDLYAN